MKKLLFLAAALMLISSLQAVSEKEMIKNLPAKYRVWLTEEVPYIITPVEKEIFLKLDSDPLRESFISAFWNQRNPNPNLSENEFRKEHYRRIAYTNNWFGRESPAPGWKTDMGRIYITLGEPKSIDRYENETELYPIIKWFYQGMAKYGLPDSFSVVFFKPDGIGEYELYSPIKSGPQALMRNYEGDATSYQDAYDALLEIHPEVAAISLSLITNEPSTSGSPSLASEMLIKARIPEAPQKQIDSMYAKKFYQYRDIVEVDYSANFIPSAKQVNVIRDNPSGLYFVHYLIEPKRLSIENYNDKFYTKLEIFGNVSDAKGKIVFQINKTVPIELNEGQIGRIKDKLFSYQDMFPLIPGKYKLTVLLKNTVSKEFTSMESDVEVPAQPVPGIGSLLLANKLLENSGNRGRSKPFLIGSDQLVPSPRNDFLASDTLILFFQLPALSAELKSAGTLQYDFLKDNVSVKQVRKRIGDYPALPDVLEKFPLNSLRPANYTLRVTLLSDAGKSLGVEESPFYITPMPAIPRPWVVSLPLSSATDPQYWNDLGNQYLNLSDLANARPLLERAHHLSPLSARFALDYCRVLVEQKEYPKAKEIALQMFRGQGRNEFLLMLAQTSQVLQQYGEAIDYYKQHVTHAGGNSRILNALGDCYQASGNSAEAISAWEKSLALDPKQDRIKEKIAALRGVKK